VKLTLSDTDTTGRVPDPLSNRESNLRVRNAAFFVSGVLVFWALISLFPQFSDENIVRLTPFVVGIAGYCFGFWAGVAASLLTIVAHTLVFNGLGYEGPLAVLKVNPAVHIGILLIGPLAGKFRSNKRKLESEVAHRKEAEAALHESEEKYRALAAKTAGVDEGEDEVIPLQTTTHNVDESPAPVPVVPAGTRNHATRVDDGFTEPSPATRTVLVADGESAVRHRVRDALRDKDYRLLMASDGETALEHAAGRDYQIDLLITSVVMTPMSGRELATELRDRRPGMKVLFLSGYLGAARIGTTELDAETSFLSKPFSLEALSRKARLLLESHPGEKPRSVLQSQSAMNNTS
jgi:CheY-like chemotaxis protein